MLAHEVSSSVARLQLPTDHPHRLRSLVLVEKSATGPAVRRGIVGVLTVGLPLGGSGWHLFATVGVLVWEVGRCRA